MSPKAMKLLEMLCQTELALPLVSLKSVPLGGYETLECLWPMNDRFRPRMEQIKTISYRKQFEKAADEAIGSYLTKDDDWSGLPLVVWRVLIERHQQAILMCVTNALAENSGVMPIPAGLSESARTKFAVAFLWYAMKLPYKLTDTAQLDIDSPFDHLSTQLH
ncbi:hypothetical protein DUQ17_22305 [Salmonella enterica subsp. diarizonae]|nr:hypothetical protein [Salmonella enterica subsp. diarizonae]